MSIFIFSGPVRTGKTSSLERWCASGKNAGGILMPDMNGKRMIRDIETGELFDIECTEPGECREPLVHVGRFFFYENAFQKAGSAIMRSAERDPGWLVIDEVGKLELGKEGFYDAVKQILPLYENRKNKGELLLVVRDSLCEEVVSFFNIRDPRLIRELP